jgi:hypothetical protein
MSDLEHLRKDAKRLLKQCRMGDADAIARIRARLTLFSELSDSEFSDRVRLAHVQQALAREQGVENWAVLRGTVDIGLEDLLKDIRLGRPITLKQLAAIAEFAEESVHAACVIGDSDGLAHHLEVDASLVYSREGGWTPLHYLAASPIHKLSFSKRYAAGIVECALILLDRDGDAYDGTSENPGGTKAATAMTLALRSKNNILVKLLDPGRLLMTANILAQAMTSGAIEGRPMPEVFKTPEFGALLLRRDEEQKKRLPSSLQDIAERRLARAPQENVERLRKEREAKLPLSSSLRQSTFEQRISERQRHRSAVPPPEERQLHSFLFWVKPQDGGLWKFALENGLDPNWIGWKDAETALHRIPSRYPLIGPDKMNGATLVELARMFLQHGADPNRANAKGRTPFVNAVRSGNVQLAELMIEYGAVPGTARPVDYLVGAWTRMDPGSARSILQANPDVQTQLSEEDRNSIVASVHNVPGLKRLEVVGESGADLNIFGSAGATPLHLASWEGNVDAVRLLLRYNAAANKRDLVYGVSAFAWAAHGSANCREADDDYRTVVAALRAAGADLESGTNRWGTPAAAVASSRVAEGLRG